MKRTPVIPKGTPIGKPRREIIEAPPLTVPMEAPIAAPEPRVPVPA